MKRTISPLQTLLGIIFLLASFDKLQHPEAFAQIVQNYQILPDVLVNGAALVLPMLEFLCGLALTFNIMPRGAAFTVTLLMTIFLSALAFNYVRGLDVACGCFTTDPSAQADTLWSLARDSLIWLLSFTVFIKLVLKQRKSR
ncbi:Methylamine utilisation protein MauE [Paucidesulfovibrio gracilis DSM 16080]|uniref:Methylamine utilisation protein MauE n=1 Tax=Paucidesulfovibrio gracilis DSM 16080 TaxID=1121449 RepID=A0A1T4WK56_9BACT|nr:MauE/DoxX family redox-associated membrane protein [Paucidesulfovibrio gracilis]SKA77710.1 Methylamine utilisation protein MauE [Paucidesulfovibrio gracilis DSM 16080]